MPVSLGEPTGEKAVTAHGEPHSGDAQQEGEHNGEDGQDREHRNDGGDDRQADALERRCEAGRGINVLVVLHAREHKCRGNVEQHGHDEREDDGLGMCFLPSLASSAAVLMAS